MNWKLRNYEHLWSTSSVSKSKEYNSRLWYNSGPFAVFCPELCPLKFLVVCWKDLDAGRSAESFQGSVKKIPKFTKDELAASLSKCTALPLARFVASTISTMLTRKTFESHLAAKSHVQMNKTFPSILIITRLIHCSTITLLCWLIYSRKQSTDHMRQLL